MRTISILFALSLGAATPIFAQTPNPRAQVLAGEFNKFKNETRNKKGVSITKYKEVVSEAWVATLADYAGRYRSDDPNLQIEIAADGSARGSGRDDGRFELRGLRVVGGLLTGTKAYSDGRTTAFEAVLLKRATRESATSEYDVRYGIGTLAELSNYGTSDKLRIFAEKQ